MASIPVPVPRPTKGPETKAAELGVVQLGEIADAHPLELAARFVDQFRQRDEKYPRFLDLAVAQDREFYSAPDILGLSTTAFVPFSTRVRALPLDLASAASLSGLLPEIDRAWLARGKQLFLWNYRLGTVHRFDDLPADVASVYVVPPKRDVFSDIVKHILVISTTDQMHLYAVSYEADPVDLTVYDTGISIPIAGLGAPRVARGISSGRIFFTTANKGSTLFEARYVAKESWFRSRSSLVTHSDGGGMFGQGDAAEHIIDITADDSRGLLYTLSSASRIRAFMYGPGESTVRLGNTYGQRDIQSFLDSALDAGQAALRPTTTDSKLPETPANGNKTPRTVKLVGISAYLASQSQHYPLSAVTDTGRRLFFRTRDEIRPSTAFRSVAIREPATDTEFPGAVSSAAIVDRDFLIAAVAQKSANAPSLFVSTTDSTRILQQVDQGSAPPVSELSGWMTVDGAIKDIALASLPQHALGNGRAGYGNTTALGYTHVPSEVAVLTSKAVYLVRTRHFYERMEVGTDLAGQLSHTYGRLELCCAALAVATRPNSVLSKQQREEAASTYFRLGGLPVFRKDIEATRNTYIHDPSTAIGATAQAAQVANSQVAVRLSSLFDGLSAYTARLLQDIWQNTIFSYSVGKDKKPTQIRLNLNKDELEHIYSNLSGLSSFLENSKAFSEGMSSRPQYSQHIYVGDVSVLNQAEQRSLNALGKLVKSSQQGIAFLLLVLSETSSSPSGLETLLSYFPADSLKNLLNISFRNFFSGAKHSEVSRELVISLVNFVINRGSSVDSLARVMQDRCDSYCSASDILIYKALQYLHTANNSTDQGVRTRNLHESLPLFKKAANDIHIDTLRDIVDEYVRYGYYEGVAELVLAVAGEVDKAGVTVGYLRDRKPEKDPREVVYKEKIAIYDLLLNVLTNLPSDKPSGKETYRIILESKDEVFHFHLYYWFLGNGMTERLSQVNTQFIQPFLQAGAKSDVRVAELLWRYYQKRDDLLAAADVLLELGRGSLVVPMPQRIEYLSRAMNYCNSYFPPNLRQQVARLTTMVASYLQIANIQADVLEHVQRDGQLDPTTKSTAESTLNSRLLSVTDLFNEFTDPLGYYDVSLEIFEVADFRDSTELQHTWENLFNKARMQDEVDGTQHYSHISSLIQTLGRRFLQSAFVFPVSFLVPYTERYAIEHVTSAPRGWVVEAFLNAGVAAEDLYTLLIEVLTQKYSPFNYPEAAKILAEDILYLLGDWVSRNGERSVSQHLKHKDLRALGELAGEEEAARFSALATH